MDGLLEKCSCEKCELRSSFFAHVDPQGIEKICRGKIETQYKRGDNIIQEGNEIIDFIYLKSGLVKLFKITDDGREQIINIAKPFDFVSLLSIFSDTHYKYSVSALEDSVICNLVLSDMKKFAEDNGKFAFDMMQKMSKITDKILVQSLEIRRRNLKGRVAFILLYFANDIYDNLTIDLPVSRKEIAEYISMSTENVIRTFSEFRDDKIIKIYGKNIEIIDLPSLERISKFG